MIVYLPQALNLFVKLTLCMCLFRVNNNVYACILVNTICFAPDEYMIPSLHVRVYSCDDNYYYRTYNYNSHVIIILFYIKPH